jgi:peptidoglycan L-alanyl-D-glutamate endopeptidase CwlK
MRDSVTEARIRDIHPSLFEELKKIYDEICKAFEGRNVGVRFVQVFRSFEEQNRMFAQGRTTAGLKVTNARGGQSYHNYGLAVDFCLLYDKNEDGKITKEEIIWDRAADLDKDKICDWMEVVMIFTKYGWKWGASFKDYPHFEKSPFNWRVLLEKHRKKEFIFGTSYLDI